MTQTQDEQNVQAAGATPVADDQAVQASTPDLSAVDLTEEAPATPVAEPAEAPVTEQPAEPAAEQPAEAPAQEQ